MKKNIFILILLVLFSLDCKKKKNEVPFVIWNSALSGTTESLRDSNGNKLPEITTIPEQSVPTRGLLSVNASFVATDCYRDDFPISCEEDNIDYSLVEYQLIDSFGSIKNEGYLNSNGSISFENEIDNGNYRLLIKDSEMINWTHYDFNYTWNPTEKNEVIANLKAKKKYYNNGPAQIFGEVYSGGFRSVSGEILLEPKKIKNVIIKLFCGNSLIDETVTDENGKYFFYQNMQNNNCYISANGEDISIYDSPLKTKKTDFRFVFNGYNQEIPTQININKIVLDWEPKKTSVINVASSIKNILPNKENFKIQIIDSENRIVLETFTDNDGKYFFNKELDRGTYTVKISKENFLTASTSFFFEPSWNNSPQNIDLPKIAPAPIYREINVPKDVFITLTPRSSYAELKELGALISDAWSENVLSAVSIQNENGKISIPPGDWDITYNKTGYLPQTYKISNFGESQMIIPSVISTMMIPAIMHREINMEISLDGIKDTSGVVLYLKNITLDNQQLVIKIPFKEGKLDYAYLKAYKHESFCFENLSFCSTLIEVNIKDSGIEKSLTFKNDKLLLSEGSYSWFIDDPLKTFKASGILNVNKSEIWGEELKTLISLNSGLKTNISGSISNAFSLSSIGGVKIEIGDYSNNIFTPIKIENNIIRNRTIDNINNLNTVNTETSTSGNWTLMNIPNGNYTLKYSKEGFETVYENVRVPKNENIFSTLISTTGKGNLSGTIVLPGGFIFNSRFSLELESPYSNRRPSTPIPIELTSGQTFFSNTTVYNLYNIDSGMWKMTFRANGYETIICWVNIGSGQNNYDVLTAVTGGQPPSKISGVIYNAVNNRAITNSLALTIRPGIKNTNGNIATKNDGSQYPLIYSSANGSFVLPDVPAGVYTLTISGENWTTTNHTVVSSEGIGSYSLFVSPILNNDEMRIVLSWADLPTDLDSHLQYGNSMCRNSDGTLCRVMWNNKVKLNRDLTLDVDVTDGYGPETITMKNTIWQKAKREYSIYNWSQQTSLGNSEAIVKVIKNGFVRTFSVPKPNINLWWNVFCLGSDMSIIEVGENNCQNSNFWNIHQ